MHNLKSNRGFTLIELLVVIAIISLLSSVVFSRVIISRERARIASGQHFAAQAAHTAGDDLAGAWELNEKSGTVARDSSGHGNNGTLNGPAGWSTDHPLDSSDGSFLFNGTTNNLYIPGSSRYYSSNSISMGAWIKHTDYTYANQKVFSTKDSGGYLLGFDNNYCTGWAFCALAYIGGSYQFAYIPGNTLKLGKWYHVFMTYDGETIKLYVDGKLAAKNEAPSGPITYTTPPLCIGNEANASDCGANEQFYGNIASARIYSRSLTAGEISNLYASEAPRFKTAQR